MKQTIKDAGLPTADLFERQHVEERYAQANARLAEAERLKPAVTRRRRRTRAQGPARRVAAAAAAESAARATDGAGATRRGDGRARACGCPQRPRRGGSEHRVRRL